MSARRFFAIMLACILLFGCNLTGGGTPPVAPAVETPAAGVDATDPAAADPVATQPPTLVSPAEAAAPTRGKGDFDLPHLTAGLDALPAYRASLTLFFDGAQSGAPYQVQKTYDLVIDRAAQARQLQETSASPQGSKAVYSAVLGSLRYILPAEGAGCTVSAADTAGPSPFEPAAILPGFLGAEAAGEEAVGAVAARVYTFDAAALNAPPSAQATGKVWVAVDGGWVVKYQLAVQSDTIFGEGISGMQTWTYEVSEVGAAQVHLPESCPASAVDLPLPDGALEVERLPGYLRFTTGQDPAAAGVFYTDSLPTQGWTAQSGSIATAAGQRYLFSRPAGDKEQIVVLTIKAEGSGALVTVFEVFTDPAPQQ